MSNSEDPDDSEGFSDFGDLDDPGPCDVCMFPRARTNGVQFCDSARALERPDAGLSVHFSPAGVCLVYLSVDRA